MANRKPAGWKQPRTSAAVVADRYGRKRPIGISDNLNSLGKLYKARRQARKAAHG